MAKKISRTLAFILMLGMLSVSAAGCYPANADADPQQQTASPTDELQPHIEQQEEDDEMVEGESSSEDFVLTIYVEETTMPQGEDFKVNVELKNNSGEDQEIIHSFLVGPNIPDWNLFKELGDLAIDPPEFRSRFFPANSVLRNIDLWGDDGDKPWSIGHTLEPGIHELRFGASFYVGEIQEDKQIEIWSNTVMLTVR